MVLPGLVTPCSYSSSAMPWKDRGRTPAFWGGLGGGLGGGGVLRDEKPAPSLRCAWACLLRL